MYGIRWFLGAIVAAGLTFPAIVAVWQVQSSFPSEVATPPASLAFIWRDTPRPLDIAFTDADGRERTLAEFRGRVVLVNLWATWCAPCLNEMPHLDRLKGALGSEDFDVIAVSVDKAGLDKSREFLERTGARHLELFVDQTMQLNFDFGVYQLPTTILIGRDGVEIGRIVGDKKWDSSEVKRFLGAVIAAGQDHGSSSLSQ